MNKKVNVSICGVSPLLMHAFSLVKVEAMEKMTAEDQAKHAEYRSLDGRLYIPGVAIQRCLVNAAAFSKGKGRASLVKVAAACVIVSPEVCVLTPQKYEIDARAVVVPATKGRVVRYRPRFDRWECSFSIEYDPTLLTEEQVRTMVDDAGSRVGLLDFNPAHKGPFGRFSVVEWKKQKE